MASSKLIHFMIFFKIAHATDEFQKSQVQNNSFKMIMLQMNLREIFKDVSDEFNCTQIWKLAGLHLFDKAIEGDTHLVEIMKC